jgi:hypothetical protein
MNNIARYKFVWTIRWSLAMIAAIETNAPPSRAISMAMAVRRCDTERIS